jgi:hypothetical protein
MDKDGLKEYKFSPPLSKEDIDELLFDIPESDRTQEMMVKLKMKREFSFWLKSNPKFDEGINLKEFREKHEQKLFFGDMRTGGHISNPLETHKLIFLNGGD